MQQIKSFYDELFFPIKWSCLRTTSEALSQNKGKYAFQSNSHCSNWLIVYFELIAVYLKLFSLHVWAIISDTLVIKETSTAAEIL